MSGKTYKIDYLDIVVNEDLPSLPVKTKKQVKRAIEQRLMVDPIAYGKPLRYTLKGYRRLRVGDYRVVYRIEPRTKTVLIVAIKHRKIIYQRM